MKIKIFYNMIMINQITTWVDYNFSSGKLHVGYEMVIDFFYISDFGLVYLSVTLLRTNAFILVLPFVGIDIFD